MTKIKIVTDSTSDLPAEIAEKYDIGIIPLNVFFGEDRYKDRKNLSPSEFYGMVESGIYEWPKTSQPSAKEFVEFYNQFFEEGFETIISIHITPNMSGTLNSVELAKRQIPDKDVIAVDGNTTTVPLGLLAYQAAKLNKEGKSKEEIITALNKKLVPRTQIVAVLDTLEYLYRGGRIGRAKHFFGKLLKKKPLMRINDGVVDSFATLSGREEAFQAIVKAVPKIFDNIDNDMICIGYTNDKSIADTLFEKIKDLPNAPSEIIISEIGPTVGAHLGTGVIALSWVGNWDNNWFLE